MMLDSESTFRVLEPEDLLARRRKPTTTTPTVGTVLWWAFPVDVRGPIREPAQVTVLMVDGDMVQVRHPDGVLVWRKWRGRGGRDELRVKKPEKCEACGGWGGHTKRCEQRRDGL